MRTSFPRVHHAAACSGAEGRGWAVFEPAPTDPHSALLEPAPGAVEGPGPEPAPAAAGALGLLHAEPPAYAVHAVDDCPAEPAADAVGVVDVPFPDTAAQADVGLQGPLRGQLAAGRGGHPRPWPRAEPAVCAGPGATAAQSGLAEGGPKWCAGALHRGAQGRPASVQGERPPTAAVARPGGREQCQGGGGACGARRAAGQP
mmetsp:Transcript_56824/g.182603  ORF Transcript_56824/g.182603 Transcript_56824/m.182603 type:complete len:202 (-) Transcript_56824:1021-1626(-)